jgi:signal transduction histidine kinase
MSGAAWSAQQLAEFLAALSAVETEAGAAVAAVHRAAEALDAEVVAIVCRGRLVAAVGYPEGEAPEAELCKVRPADGARIPVPGTGLCPASAVELEHPVGGTLVLARSGEPLTADESALLTGMARVTSMTMRMLRLLEDVREAQEQVAASRARMVATEDRTRRRIERDLHDGAQQRLVTLALELRAAKEAVPAESPELEGQLAHLEQGLKDVLDELHEISRGVHPAVLSDGGIEPALKALARRSPLPVELRLGAIGRLPEAVEAAAYYAVCEALSNTIKHGRASGVQLIVQARHRSLWLAVSDDGVGGVDRAKGSGIVGLTDRVQALGGRILVTSPRGKGTSILVELPIEGR